MFETLGSNYQMQEEVICKTVLKSVHRIKYLASVLTSDITVNPSIKLKTTIVEKSSTTKVLECIDCPLEAQPRIIMGGIGFEIVHGDKKAR